VDLGVAAILIPIGFLFIIFNKSLGRSVSNNLSKVLPWDVSDKDFRIEYILVGIVFIVMGLLGSFRLL